VVGIGGQ
ncbi:hypothetical protein CFC21_009634, partial [Triticum aestivum]